MYCTQKFFLIASICDSLLLQSALNDCLLCFVVGPKLSPCSPSVCVLIGCERQSPVSLMSLDPAQLACCLSLKSSLCTFTCKLEAINCFLAPCALNNSSLN